MTKTELIAKIDKIFRPHLIKLPPEISSYIYSIGRKYFLSTLSRDIPNQKYLPPQENSKRLWDLNFASPLFNAAGMFKYAESYYTIAAQGAGAYLAGTTTSTKRRGNEKLGIIHPFIPFPDSRTAINWMGLPNDSHAVIAKRISQINKQEGCPIGISIAASPELKEKDALIGLIDGFNLFEKAGVDFVELNESCPNVTHDCEIINNSTLDLQLINRLEYITNEYLNKRKRRLPVIIKLSNDTDEKLLPEMIDLLIDLEFDGLNLGNTSTNYSEHIKMIAETDKKNFQFFINNFGGGLSGLPLKKSSLQLASAASKYVKEKYPSHEFHIIRTGGIENSNDIAASEKLGISLNQWFTGYFENFSNYGHQLYKHIFE